MNKLKSGFPSKENLEQKERHETEMFVVETTPCVCDKHHIQTEKLNVGFLDHKASVCHQQLILVLNSQQQSQQRTALV